MTKDKTEPHLSDQAKAEHVGQPARQTQKSREDLSGQPAGGRKPLFRS